MTVSDGSADATAMLWPSASALKEVVGNGHAVDLLYQLEPAQPPRMGARLTLVDARNSVLG